MQKKGETKLWLLTYVVGKREVIVNKYKESMLPSHTYIFIIFIYLISFYTSL